MSESSSTSLQDAAVLVEQLKDLANKLGEQVSRFKV